MKKSYEICPYCANEIKEGAIKCQYCHEFLRDKENNCEKKTLHGKKQTREVNKVKKWSRRRKWGLALMLVIPVIMVLWLLVSIVFRFIGAASVSAAYETGYNSYGNGTPLIYTIRNAINWLLGMLSVFGLVGFIPGLIMFLKPDTDYDPYIDLKTKPSNLYEVYKPYFDVDSLPSQDIQEMKYNGLISNLHVAWAVIFNILTLGLFSTMYYGLKHSDLPRIRRNDFSAGKGIGYLFIPLYNLYWVFVFWLRLVDRLNFQYTIRGEEKPISRGLTLTCIILKFIPYLNIFSVVILQSILVGKIQNAINGLVSEK